MCMHLVFFFPLSLIIFLSSWNRTYKYDTSCLIPLSILNGLLLQYLAQPCEYIISICISVLIPFISECELDRITMDKCNVCETWICCTLYIVRITQLLSETERPSTDHHLHHRWTLNIEHETWSINVFIVASHSTHSTHSAHSLSVSSFVSDYYLFLFFSFIHSFGAL